MADRTKYFTSVAGAGELKLLRGGTAATADKGLTAADLAAADVKAFDKINLFLVDLAGRLTGAAIIAEFRDDANPLDPIFVRLAELLAAYTILATWEEFNYGSERSRDADMARAQLEAERVKKEAYSILETLCKTKASVKSDGTVRKLAFKRGSMGPVVVGPMSKGSYFDYQRYVDALGTTHAPRQTDPYKDV